MKLKDLREGYLYNVRGQLEPLRYRARSGYSPRHVCMSKSNCAQVVIALTNILGEYIPTHYTLHTKVHFDSEDLEVCLEAYPFLEQRRALIFDVETARLLRDQLSLVLDSLPVD